MRILVSAMLAALSWPAGASSLRAERLAVPVAVERNGITSALNPGAVIQHGATLRTGPGGRLELRSAQWLLLLAEQTDFYLHQISHQEVRAVLLGGAAQLANLAGEAQLRINLGELKLQADGAELWLAAEALGDTVCLLHGSVEILAPDQATYRLQQRGDCLWQTRDQRSLLIPAASHRSLPLKLSRTELDLPETEDGWTIVLSEHSHLDAARKFAHALQAQGMILDVLQTELGDYQVTSGLYRDYAQAAAVLADTQRKFPNAWVAIR